MKRIGIVITILGLLVLALLALIIFEKRSSPIIFCVPLDGGIRPRNHCLLNPFRNRDAEAISERLLEELNNGNIDALIPYLADRNTDHQERYLSNEKQYRIKAWRIGEIEMSGNEPNIQYWVSRSNYQGEEEVRFFFLRTSEGWNLRSYTAIY
jgi:hypothetical protein